MLAGALLIAHAIGRLGRNARTDLDAIFGIDGHIPGIKETMKIGAQEQGIRQRMRTILRIGADVSSYSGVCLSMMTH